MNSTERVRRTILGEKTDRQPIYGWVKENLNNEITGLFGSVDAFEDYYQFDASMIFGSPWSFNNDVLDRLRAENEELTPDILVNYNIFSDPYAPKKYDEICRGLEFHKKRDRFCYIHTPGFFEHFNSIFGIQNHLLYLAMYPDEIAELYSRQAEWTVGMIDMCAECGADMSLFSDDWGSQKALMFSPQMWRELVFPNLKRVVDHAHSRKLLTGLHSDGCIMSVADGLCETGLDLVHPWQENAGMSLDVYNEKYSDKFAIMGGICVQSSIGILSRDELEADIRRVFSNLRGKRWICCTSHYVQNHCSMDDLVFAFDLIHRLARDQF